MARTVSTATQALQEHRAHPAHLERTVPQANREQRASQAMPARQANEVRRGSLDRLVRLGQRDHAGATATRDPPALLALRALREHRDRRALAPPVLQVVPERRGQQVPLERRVCLGNVGRTARTEQTERQDSADTPGRQAHPVLWDRQVRLAVLELKVPRDRRGRRGHAGKPAWRARTAPQAPQAHRDRLVHMELRGHREHRGHRELKAHRDPQEHQVLQVPQDNPGPPALPVPPKPMSPRTFQRASHWRTATLVLGGRSPSATTLGPTKSSPSPSTATLGPPTGTTTVTRVASVWRSELSCTVPMVPNEVHCHSCSEGTKMM